MEAKAEAIRKVSASKDTVICSRVGNGDADATRGFGMRQALETLSEDLDRTVSRPLQKEAFKCSAACCDTAKNQTDLQSCVQSCSEKVQRMEAVVNHELGDFQQRLQRCAVRCQDVSRERLPAEPSDSQLQEAQKRMEGCISTCAQDFESQIPGLGKRIKEMCTKL